MATEPTVETVTQVGVRLPNGTEAWATRDERGGLGRVVLPELGTREYAIQGRHSSVVPEARYDEFGALMQDHLVRQEALGVASPKPPRRITRMVVTITFPSELVLESEAAAKAF